jgi:hypothetical protein
MNGRAGTDSFGRTRSKREPVEVLEPKKQDRSLDKLINVRKQRLNRLERERTEALEAWRNARIALRAAKEAWREALAAANANWQEARARFFKMSTTSGKFRQEKAIYERMKEVAAQLRLQAQESVRPCREAGHHFFEAKERILEANRQQEKLGILRDELLRLSIQEEP